MNSNAPGLGRRVADAINALKQEQQIVLDRLFTRVEALEKGMMGTPSEPGLVGKFETLKVDLENKFAQQIKLMQINNWLTGLVVALLVAAALKVLFGSGLA